MAARPRQRRTGPLELRLSLTAAARCRRPAAHFSAATGVSAAPRRTFRRGRLFSAVPYRYFPQASIAEMAKLYAGAYPSFSWERYEKMKQVFPLNDRQMLRRMS